MKRTPMPDRRKPMRRGGQLQRTASFPPPVVSSNPETRKRGSKTVSAGRLTRKQASEAALAAVRPVVLARADGRCEVTGLPLVDHPHLHHRRKRLGPDRDVPSNLLVVNPNSHLAVFAGSIHAEPVIAKRFGWIVPHGDWRSVPVLIRGVRVLLDDVGGYIAIPAV